MPLRPQAGREQRICVARIGAAHGLQGELRLWSFTQDPHAIARYGALQTLDGKRALTITALRDAKDCLIAKFDGVNDRNAAEALRNADLYIDRALLPETDEDDTFYIADLVGLAAHDVGGAHMGDVIAVHNFGAGDIVEIKKLAGGDTLLLPFTQAAVPAVDLAGGKITIDPPAETEAKPGDEAE